MSETGNADLFKSRLAQLKKVLERDAKIAENLFYAAMQLDKNKELKAGVLEIIEKHKLKAKKGYLYLPDDEKDRPGAVKALLKDAFDFLLKAFNVDKAQLVQRKAPEQKVHAIGLFELQSTLESQSTAQAHAFESTMQDLDTIDTSTPLEQTVIVPPPSETEDVTSPEASPPKTPAPKDVPVPPTPPVQPAIISKLAVTEQITGKPSEGGKSAGVVPIPVSNIPRKAIPLPPRSNQRGTIQATPVVPQVVPAAIAPPKPVQKPAGAPAAVRTMKPVPSPPAAAKAAPAPPSVVKPAPAPPAVVKPAPAPATPVAPVVPSPITYEYYVCNRCGAETSKSVIRQVGTYLECPKCKFSFSRAEAVVIQKAAPGSEQTTKSDQEETKKPFDIYASKQPGEDESLIRPSMLFADREDESKTTVRKVAPAKVAEGGRPKPRAVPTDRLVRPSEFLGLKDDQVPAEQAATTAKKPAEKPVSESEKIVKHEASEYFSDQEPSLPVSRPASADTQKIAEAPASEYFVEETPDHPAWKKSPEALPVVAPEANTPLIVAVAEQAAPGDACPKCGALKYSKIQDRTKVISYNPLMYGYKKKCTMCSHEFD